ncbi:hypothetical protein V1477_002137 [Vespula maculifrons]|uniref:Uncharacterized protein n=1 Tax=Vespula maculifrons TaxID=7453 RepID=A0ABD2CVU5_VESMC
MTLIPLTTLAELTKKLHTWNTPKYLRLYKMSHRECDKKTDWLDTDWNISIRTWLNKTIMLINVVSIPNNIFLLRISSRIDR